MQSQRMLSGLRKGVAMLNQELAALEALSTAVRWPKKISSSSLLKINKKKKMINKVVLVTQI
jgi:hypothetical protein